MRTIVVLAKAPRPGLTKTRLAVSARRTLAQAAQLAHAFVADTLAHCRAASADQRWIGFAPPDAEPEFAALAPDFTRFAQVQGDLGARIAAAFAVAFAAGAARVLVIGSDTPQLGPAALEDAFQRLERCDLVLGPARDGGYYLVGLTRALPEMFTDIAWSTERVRAQTLARAAVRGLRTELLDELEDIDGDGELARLEERLAREPQLAPATAQALLDLDSR